MVTKPIRLICYTFLLACLDMTVYNVQLYSDRFERTHQHEKRLINGI